MQHSGGLPGAYLSNFETILKSDVLDSLDLGSHNNIEHKSGGKEGFMLDQKCLQSIAAYLKGNTDFKR